MNANAIAEVRKCSASSQTPGVDKVALQCPACGQRMAHSALGEPNCRNCGFKITQVDGVFRALPHERLLYFNRFMTEYRTIREKEGRSSTSADYYLALPFRDLTGRNAEQWKIRSRTFLRFEREILPRIAALNESADILDIGAGNGWLSYRLALKGHRPIALDLADNSSDGLGAAQHFFSQLREPFPCFQAEMDRLPFASRQFDAVIFDASFHYSLDYEVTLNEALRCLRRPGYLVIADSPLYRRAESGEQMVTERKQLFRRKFGFASDALASKEFLTPEILSGLSRRFALSWHISKPWYGLAWALRPTKARVLRKREPSKFYLLWTRVER